MDMDKLMKKLSKGENGAYLQALTRSESGARLAARLDGGAVEKAVRSGDDTALREVLESVLQTPEGRDFAAKVRETMSGHGR